MPASRLSRQHLLVSAAGAALPRWQAAFPLAQQLAVGSLTKSPSLATLVWLRLDPTRTAAEEIRTLRKIVGAAPILVLANHPNNDEALDAFAAGARAYCNAHATTANLRQVAKVVQSGGLWIGEALMHRLLAATHAMLSGLSPANQAPADAGTPTADSLAALTGREREVARCVAAGSSNKEIGRALKITERTVKAHAGSIFTKLGARDRLHLALIVNGHGRGVPRPANPETAKEMLPSRRPHAH